MDAFRVFGIRRGISTPAWTRGSVRSRSVDARRCRCRPRSPGSGDRRRTIDRFEVRAGPIDADRLAVGELVDVAVEPIFASSLPNGTSTAKPMNVFIGVACSTNCRNIRPAAKSSPDRVCGPDRGSAGRQHRIPDLARAQRLALGLQPRKQEQVSRLGSSRLAVHEVMLTTPARPSGRCSAGIAGNCAVRRSRRSACWAKRPAAGHALRGRSPSRQHGGADSHRGIDECPSAQRLHCTAPQRDPVPQGKPYVGEQWGSNNENAQVVPCRRANALS